MGNTLVVGEYENPDGTGPKVNSSSKPKYTISYTVNFSPCNNSAKETIKKAQTAIMSLN